MTTNEIIKEQIERLEWQIKYMKGCLDDSCKTAIKNGFTIKRDGDHVVVISSRDLGRMIQSDMDETRGIIMGLSVALDGLKKLSVSLDKSDELTANEACQQAGLPPCLDMRYIGHGESLEHGKVYLHCTIREFEITPSECNIEVTVTDPWTGLIVMKMLYRSLAEMLTEWELIE